MAPGRLRALRDLAAAPGYVRSVVCIGGAVLDLVALVDEPPSRDQRVLARDATLAGGGVAATSAVTLARLGVPVAFVGTIGDDDASRMIRNGLEREGVDTVSLQSAHGKPTLSTVLIDRASGQRAISAFYPDHGPLRIDDRVARAARDAAWVHVDHRGWQAVATLRAAGVQTAISVDHGNPIPDLDLEHVALYGPTEERILERYPGMGLHDAIGAALSEGPRITVVTRGSRGAVVGVRQVPSSEVVVHESAAYEVDVVSNLGAGDVFHGAFLAAHVRGMRLTEALACANAAAAISCRALDGRSGIPTWDEIHAFLALRGVHVSESDEGARTPEAPCATSRLPW